MLNVDITIYLCVSKEIMRTGHIREEHNLRHCNLLQRNLVSLDESYSYLSKLFHVKASLLHCCTMMS